MTGTVSLHSTREDHLVAYLAALAIVIHIAESVLPSPLPGIKPGLANIVTVAVLCHFGWRIAAWVSLLRVLVGSLLIGTFLAPTFIMGFSGALAAIGVLGLVRYLPGIGPVGLSVLSSLAHMAAQFSAAYLLFIPHPALLNLLPILMTAALVFGIVNGVLAAAMLRELRRVDGPAKLPPARDQR